MRTKTKPAKSVRLYRRNFVFGSNGKQIEVAPTLLADSANVQLLALAVLQDTNGKHWGRKYIMGDAYRGIKWDKKYNRWIKPTCDIKYKLALRMWGKADPFYLQNVVKLTAGAVEKGKVTTAVSSRQVA